ncbi:MAG TPA: hypothetical protein VND64_16780 [Pirellulales bacterium]|nr:hypothetical protein [Pirellulales bacterium]
MYRTMILAAVFLVGVTGCTPSPPKPEELGRVIYDPAAVPGLDDPYRPPELDEFPLIKAPPAVDKPPEGDGLPKDD